MNDTSAHIAALDQTDEDILTYTASDEALELAAAGSLGALCTYRWGQRVPAAPSGSILVEPFPVSDTTAARLSNGIASSRGCWCPISQMKVARQ